MLNSERCCCYLWIMNMQTAILIQNQNYLAWVKNISSHCDNHTVQALWSQVIVQILPSFSRFRNNDTLSCSSSGVGHHQLVLSWYHYRPESHQQSFNQSSWSELERPGPIDWTPGPPGSCWTMCILWSSYSPEYIQIFPVTTTPKAK